MSAPVCPKHNVQMRESQKSGGYYCPKKDGELWCSERVKTPTAVTATVTTPAGTPSDARWAAALAFAGHIYRGAGPEMVDDALALAKRVYGSFPS